MGWPRGWPVSHRDLGLREPSTSFVTPGTQPLALEAPVARVHAAYPKDQIGGLVLWWPRKILPAGSASSWKRTNFDLHNVLGFYSSLVMLFITLSGVLIAFEGTTDPLVKRLNHAPDAPAPQSTPSAGATRISVDEAIAIAEEALPGAFASNVGIPNGPKAVFRILKKFPEDRTPAGRSRVYVDRVSGKVLLVENTRTAPLGTRILNLKRSARTGDIFGAPTRPSTSRQPRHRTAGDDGRADLVEWA